MSIVNSFFKEILINKGVNRYNFKPISVANYSPYKYFNNVLYISGQLPIDHNGNIIKGKVGDNLSIKEYLI